MRVAMFTLLTIKNAASRAFCYQYLPYLRAARIDVKVFPPSSVLQYELLCERVTMPLIGRLLRALYWYVLVLPTRLYQIVRALGSDVIFIQRGLLRYRSAPVLEFLLWLLCKRLRGARLIYQLDDALYFYAPPRYFHWRFRMADLVMTGNRIIADYARRSTARVVVHETPLDLATFKPRQRRRNGNIVIGWIGNAPSDLGRLPEQVMERFASRHDVTFRLIGPPAILSIQGPRIEHVLWSLRDEVANLHSLDMGVMPLEDTEYNQAREAYKLKQYMAVGIPVVASPVGKALDLVEEGVNGFFARGVDEWVAHLRLLVDNPDLRSRMGAAGRRMMERRYNLELAVPRFIRLLQDARSKPDSTVEGAIGRSRQ